MPAWKNTKLTFLLFGLIFLISLSSATADTPSSSNVSTVSSNTIRSITPTSTLPPIKNNPNPNGNRTKAKITIPKYNNIHSGHNLDDILCEENQGKMYHPQHNPPKTKQIIQPKVKWKTQIFRVYLLNVNGISLGNEAADLTDVFLQMENIRADAICLTETKLAADQPYVKRLLHSAKNKVWDHAKIVASDSKLNVSESYRKPGGTITAITNHSVGRAIDTEIDPLGRWSSIILGGKDLRKLIIITAYQVPQRTGSFGETTAYEQQRSLLRQAGKDNPNPRREFIKDLRKLLKKHHQANNHIILTGDFNEELGEDPHGITSLVIQFNLIDTYSAIHGVDDSPTYSRGQRRIDYILCSKEIYPYIHKTGIEAFNQRIFSDHRGVFIDIKQDGLFDRDVSPIASSSGRDLQSKNANQVLKYVATLSQLIAQHRLQEKLQTIQENQDHDLAETIDKLMTESMLAAEKKVKYFKRLPWSTEVHTAMTKLYITKMQLTQIKTQRDMSKQIQSRQSTLVDLIPSPKTIEEANQALTNARKECRKIAKEKRHQLKTKEADRLAALQLANPDKDPQKLAHQFERAMETTRMFANLPSIKPRSTGGLSSLKLPAGGIAQVFDQDKEQDPKEIPRNKLDISNEWITITDPQVIENQILERNRRHFGQARLTPLASNTIQNELLFSGVSSTADDLLYGRADISSLTQDLYAQEILHECERSIQEINHLSDQHHLRQRYGKWKETTSTSPSNRHLGHYHSLLQTPPLDPDSAETKTFHAATKQIWNIHHGIHQYAIDQAYCFKRWQNVVNTMIEKDPGDPRIHRLRVIHLYEADYSLLIGNAFRRVLHKMEDANLMNPGCYGNRPTRSALDPVLIEVLQLEYSWATRYPHIKFSNDATSCYDRIIPSVSNVLARSYGLHRNVSSIHGDMLQHACYRIKTKLGVSKQYYSHCQDFPIYGTGQGSTSSPNVWAINASTYFNVYDKHCFGATYTNPSLTKTLNLGMTGFVDDNNSQVTGLPETMSHPLVKGDSEQKLIERCSHDAQLWNDILWASGGALEVPKCHYVYLKFQFQSTGKPFLTPGQHGPPVQVIDQEGMCMKIKQLSCDEPYKILGTQQAAVLFQAKQFQVLSKKAMKLNKALSCSSVSRTGAYVFYSSVFLTSVGYPLALCHLTENQLQALQTKIVPTVLQKLGYVHSFKRDLIYGPTRYGGQGFHNLIYEQGIQAVILLIRTLRSPGQPQQKLLITLDRQQAQSGFSKPLLQFPALRAPHLEGYYINMIRKFLKTQRASMDIADLEVYPTLRLNDKHLMDIAASSKFSAASVRRINYCRMYLDVTTISDITNPKGNQFLPGILEGDRTIHLSASIGSPPFQARPDEKAWQAWRKFLKLIAIRTTLKTPLGSWIVSGSSLPRTWPFLHSTMTDRLYCRQGSEYEIHCKVRTHVYSYSRDWSDAEGNTHLFPTISPSLLPSDAIPVSPKPLSDGWQIPPICAPVKPQTTFHNTFAAYVQDQPTHIASLLSRFRCEDIYEFTRQSQNLSNLVCVSDGGAILNSGSFGWVIAQSDGTRLASGQGTVFGHDPKSYRSEAYGCKAVMHFLLLAHKFCDIHMTGQLTVTYDNEGLKKKLTYFNSYRLAPTKSVLDSEWDVVFSIHSLRDKFPLAPQFTWVKGHTDNMIAFKDLPLLNQLNVEADTLATHELHHYSSYFPLVPFDPTSKVQLHINGVTVTRRYATTLQTICTLPALKIYYEERFNWSKKIFDTIDWDTFSTVFSKSKGKRNFLTKFCVNHLPTGKRLHERVGTENNLCPTCLADIETDDHLVQCRHPSRARWRSDFTKTIHSRLEPFLCPVLLDILRKGISHYLNAAPAPNPATYGIMYAQLVVQQNAIGWDHFFRGKWSRDWIHLQKQYLARIGKRASRSQEQWTTSLLRLIWDKLHNIWCQRNKRRHGHDSRLHRDLSLDRCKRIIISLYELRGKVQPQDDYVFYEKLEDHLEQNVEELRQWIAVNQPLLTYSARSATRAATLNTNVLSKYFVVPPTVLSGPKKTHRTQPTPPLATHRSTFITEHLHLLPPRERPQRNTIWRPPIPRPRQRCLHDFFPDHPG